MSKELRALEAIIKLTGNGNLPSQVMQQLNDSLTTPTPDPVDSLVAIIEDDQQPQGQRIQAVRDLIEIARGR